MPRAERPLVPDGSALVEFAAELRKLRQEAGTPSYRELARRAHFSSTTLSDAAGGKRMPSLAATVAYVQACGGDVGAWEQRWRDLVRTTAPFSGPRHEAAERAPYVGLAAYRVEDADWFHGREALVDDLSALVADRRFVTVVGPSGVGKSSLLRAGLVSRLRSRGVPVVLFTPGSHPVEECAVGLARLLGGTPAVTQAELVSDPRGLHRLVRQARALEQDTDLVLVIDQFEELFTLCRDSEERSTFIDLLARAWRADSSRCRVVIGIRADFYGHCLLDAELTRAVREAHLAVGPMTVDELRRAIVGPAQRSDCVVESALLTTLVAQATGHAGALPLLSHALLETWRYRKGNTLTLAGYERTGAIDGALARTAEDVFAALDPMQQIATRNLFLRLVELGEGTQDTKRRVARTEFDPEVDAIITRFADARLLVLTSHEVESAHEALLGGWPRLRAWLAADRDGQRLHRQLTEAAATWVQHHRDHGALLRGARLSIIAEWARDRTRLNRTEREFLDTSVAAEHRERRGVRRRAFILRACVVLLVVLVVTVTTTAIRANRQRDMAVALHVVRLADDLLDSDPRLAARMSLVAYRLHPTQVTREALISTSAAATAVPLNTLSFHSTIDPLGRFLAFGDRATDTTVLSATTATGITEVARLIGGDRSAVYSHNGDMMATVDKNATVRLFDIAEPRPPYLMSTLPMKAQDVQFGNHGDVLVATEVAQAPRDPDGPPTRWKNAPDSHLWDISDPRQPRHLATLPDSSAEVIKFSPDGRAVVAVDLPDGTGAGKITVWTFHPREAPRLAGRLDTIGHHEAIDAAFLDSYRLVVLNTRGDLWIWDLSEPITARPIADLDSYTQNVGQIALSPGKQKIGTAGVDTGPMVWDVASPTSHTLAAELRRPSETMIASLAFSRDGGTLHAVLLKYADDATGQPTASSLVSWRLDAESAATSVCDETEQMTDLQWERYFGDLPYRSGCE
ncbi:nSTAND1 domain-containing NTPase [Actinokineospora sp. 24-640]